VTERVHHHTCPLCEAACGLTTTLRDETIVRIEGDRDDPFSRGFVCPKGATLKHLHEDPDRLRAPLIRRGAGPDGPWETVGWDEAFAEVERRLGPILQTHGRDAVAIYLGNPTVHHLAGLFYVRPLVQALGSRNVYSASTVDQMPKHVSSGLLFGDPNAIPVPDLDRTDFLLLLGANPLESNGSLCTAPDFPGRLAAIRARGGRVVVVDPRRTRTAEAADEHLPIRPGSDAFLLAAMIHAVLEAGAPPPPHCSGLDELRRAVAPFSPEAVAARTRVPAETTRRLAGELRARERAAVYGRIGTHTVEFGTLAAWAVDVLNAVSGHLDRPGGAMWPLGAHQSPGDGRPGKGFRTGRHKSRVKGYPEVRGELPVATLADEIETPGPGQVRALITVAGNPVLSTPDGGRLDRALAGLACVVSVDPYRNETTRRAHVILPPPSPLQRSQCDLAFYALAVRNVIKWSPPLYPRSGPSEADILARLTLIASGAPAGDPAPVHQLVERGLLARAGLSPGVPLEAEEPTDRAVEILVRGGAWGDRFGQVPGGLTFARLREAVHGIDLGPLQPRLPEVLRTPSGTIELLPPAIAADLARLGAALATPPPELVLVGRRDLRSNNSWMHNLQPLVKGPRRCTLQVHPEDAARLGLSDGGSARVASRVGALIAPVEVTDRVMPGVVCLPHGWGHDLDGASLTVARAHAGVNSNLLTDGAALDPLSGNAVLNGIPVSVTPA
jgi:anaerobic selenocysteine-containing dehydrogenase